MPCYRCGTRQIDPERGSSPWRRGVRTDHQVLICPDCQTGADWVADLDRCRECTSVHLVRRLGEVECRDCGAVAESGVSPASATAFGGVEQREARFGIRLGAHLAAPDAGGMAPGQNAPRGLAPVPPSLADEVEEALRRVFGRAARPSGVGSAET